ncbi:phosphate/phosphite/phosphonate ABC transporter substrate-binding protein [Ignatzschineria sp. LJL83]
MLNFRIILMISLLFLVTSISWAENNNPELVNIHNNIKSPKTLILSFAPFEEYIDTDTIFNPLLSHLEVCLNQRVIFYPMQSNEAEIAAMQSGRLHIAGFSTGSIVTAVNKAGAIPFATQGNSEGFVGAELIMIVRSDSPYQTLSDLKQKRIAHSNATSLTGHLAPLTFFPKEGLTPEKDYPILFSGKHDQSILGVLSGDYDAATTTTEIFDRMVEYQEINPDNFRIIYRSQTFPSAAFAYSPHLTPELQKNIQQCFFNFELPSEMRKGFGDAERFVPINYEQDWAHIREILDASSPL